MNEFRPQIEKSRKQRIIFFQSLGIDDDWYLQLMNLEKFVENSFLLNRSNNEYWLYFLNDNIDEVNYLIGLPVTGRMALGDPDDEESPQFFDFTPMTTYSIPEPFNRPLSELSLIDIFQTQKIVRKQL